MKNATGAERAGIISANACGFAAQPKAFLIIKGRCRRGSITRRRGATSQFSLMHTWLPCLGTVDVDSTFVRTGSLEVFPWI